MRESVFRRGIGDPPENQGSAHVKDLIPSKGLIGNVMYDEQ